MSTEEAVKRNIILRAGVRRTEYLTLSVRQVDSGSLGWDPHVLFLSSVSVIIYFIINMNVYIPFYSLKAGVGVMGSQN